MLAYHDNTLRSVYQDFAAFGATRGAGLPMMDGPKFAKFAKDCKLVDKAHLTSTDVDLIFAKAKTKSERRISYEQFCMAVSMMADKKYPEQAGDSALDALMKKVITSQGPKASSATVADSSGIYGKLTDASLYTGAHKERFNADGSGKGLDGRDRVSKGAGNLRGVTNAMEFGISSTDDHSPPVSDDEESNEYLAEEVAKLGVTPTKTKATSPSKSTSLSKSASSSPSKAPTVKTNISPSMTKANSMPLSKTPSPTSKTAPKTSIFDKLTDSSQYTGSHKNRFNSDGSGRGAAGRDSIRKGGVAGTDLSQMLRK